MPLQLAPLARKFLPVVLAGGMIVAALSGCGGSGGGTAASAPVPAAPAPPPPVPPETRNLGIHEFAGAVGAQSAMTGLVDGTGAQARFSNPGDLAADQSGNVYVVDRGNGVLRKVTAAGVVTTLARPAATAVAAAAGASGNLYLLDGGPGVKLITPAGAETTLLPSPDVTVSRIATDKQGNLYTSSYTWRYEFGHPCSSYGPPDCDRIYTATLHKLTPGGAWATVAAFDNVYRGRSGQALYGLVFAGGIAVDAAGTVYASDPLKNVIVKVTAAGVVTTLAGTQGAAGVTNGVGAAASFRTPTDLAVDAAGNAYVNDSDNCLIRKITPAGVVTTVAGTVGRAELVTGGLPGRLSYVSSMVIDANGDLVLSVQNGLVKITLS